MSDISNKIAANAVLCGLGILALAFSSSALVSCVREGADTPLPVGRDEVRVNYSIEGIEGGTDAYATRTGGESSSPALAPLTRSVDATAAECVLNDVDIIFFGQDDNYLTVVPVNVTAGTSYFSFKVPEQLTVGTPYKTLIVGNMSSYLRDASDLVSYIGTLGDKKDRKYDTVREYLAAVAEGRVKASSPLPMWGEVCAADGSVTDFMVSDDDGHYTFSGHLVFRRSVCRIDLKSNVADKLIIAKVKLNNYRNGGYFFHSDVVYGGVSKGLTGPDADWTEVAPPSDGSTYQELKSALYSFPNIVPLVTPSDEVTTCLMIAGYFQDGTDNTPSAPKTKLTYYRFNFSGDGGHQILRRNHAYAGIVNRVSGPGADTEEEAMTSNVPKINIDVDNIWDDDDIVPVVDDKGNWMLLSRRSVSFFGEAGLKDTVKVRVKDGLTWSAAWETAAAEYPDKDSFSFTKAEGLLALATLTDNDSGRMRQARLKVTATGATVTDPLSAYVDVMQVAESVILTVDGQTPELTKEVSDDGSTLAMVVRTGSRACKWKVSASAGSFVTTVPSAGSDGEDGGLLSVTVPANTTGAARTCTLTVRRFLKNGDADNSTPSVDVIVSQEANGILKVDGQEGTVTKNVQSLVDTLRMAVLTGNSECKWKVEQGDGVSAMASVISPAGSASGADGDSLRVAIKQNSSTSERNCTLTVKRLLPGGEEDSKTPAVTIRIVQSGDQTLTVDGKTGVVVFEVGGSGDDKTLKTKVVSTGPSGLKWKAVKDPATATVANAMLTISKSEGNSGEYLDVAVTPNPSKTAERVCTLTVKRVLANGSDDEATPAVSVVYKQKPNDVLTLDGKTGNIEKTAKPQGETLSMLVMAGYSGFKWKATDESGNVKSSGVTWTESGSSASTGTNMTVTVPGNFTGSSRTFTIKVSRATDDGNEDNTASPVYVTITQSNENTLTVGGKTGTVTFNASALGETSGASYYVVSTGASGLKWKATVDSGTASVANEMLTITKSEGSSGEKLEVGVKQNTSSTVTRSCTLSVKRMLANGSVDTATPEVKVVYDQAKNNIVRVYNITSGYPVGNQSGTVNVGVPATGASLQFIVMSGFAGQNWKAVDASGCTSAGITWTKQGGNAWYYGSGSSQNKANMNVEIPANLTNSTRTCTLTVKRATSTWGDDNTGLPVNIVFTQAAMSTQISVTSDVSSWKGGRMIIDGFADATPYSIAKTETVTSIKFNVSVANSQVQVIQVSSTFSISDVNIQYHDLDGTYNQGQSTTASTSFRLSSQKYFNLKVARMAPGDPDINGTITIEGYKSAPMAGIKSTPLCSLTIPITIKIVSKVEIGDVIIRDDSGNYLLVADRNVGAPSRINAGSFVTSKSSVSSAFGSSWRITGYDDTEYRADWDGTKYLFTVTNNNNFVLNNWYNVPNGSNKDDAAKYSKWYKTSDVSKWSVPTQDQWTLIDKKATMSKKRIMVVSDKLHNGAKVVCFLPHPNNSYGGYWTNSTNYYYFVPYYVENTPGTLKNTSNSSVSLNVRLVRSLTASEANYDSAAGSLK